MALLEQPSRDPHGLVTPEEAKQALNTGDWPDDAALKLVVQDAINAENYERSKEWIAAWIPAASLYQSPYVPRFWEGSTVQRASVPFFTVALAVNSLAPQILNGLFFENPPFLVQERAGTTSQEARAVGDILAYQLDDTEFREELRLGVINGLLFGTTIWKWGWERFTKEKVVLKRKAPQVNEANPIQGGPNLQVHSTDDDLEEQVTEIKIDRPYFQHIVNLKHVLVDPTLNVPNIAKAKFVIERMYMTYEELDKLRDLEGFDIPSKEKLLELFFPPRELAEAAQGESGIKNMQYDMRSEDRWKDGTVDPFQEPLEVLWRWSKDKLIVALQKKAILFNGDNEYEDIPFLSVNWWDVPDAFFGIGLAKTIGSEQQIQQGITQRWLDNADLNLNGIYVRVNGQNVPTQSIRIAPGKIVNVTNKDDFKPLDRLPAVPEAGEHISMSQARVDQLAGAGALNTSGMAAGHSNLARTAAGANLLGSSSTTAPDYVEKLANNVIIPLLYRFQEMNFRLLPPSMMERILSDELSHEYIKQGGDLLNLYNAKVKFSILAGAKMQARKNMAQALPILFQLVGNEQIAQQLMIANKRVDMVELVRMLWETTEFKNFNDVFVDMTPAEAQRAQMNSPAAKVQAQAQAQAQMQEQKKNDQLDIIDSENTARAGREVLRAALEKATEPEIVTGQPGGVGFGSGE